MRWLWVGHVEQNDDMRCLNISGGNKPMSGDIRVGDYFIELTIRGDEPMKLVACIRGKNLEFGNLNFVTATNTFRKVSS